MWLDHIVSTVDALASLENIEICYGLATSDHIPITMVLNVDNVPKVVKHEDDVKIDWDKLSNDVVLKYCFRSDELLNKVYLPMNAMCCTNVNCDDSFHGARLCDMYNNIVRAPLEASRCLFTHPRKAKNIKPGWNTFVASPHAEADAAHRAWVIAGRPRQGPDLDYKKKMNAKYKYALRYNKSRC